MKKIIVFSIVLFSSIPVFAQFTLEHTYNNAGYFKLSFIDPNNFQFGKYSFYLVHLEIDGDKYVKIDRGAQTIDFYDLNHVFWKSINYSAVPTNISSDPNHDKANCSILYISQSLFDTDTEIEFMYSFYKYYPTDTSNKAITQIVNEDGSILFSDAAAPLVQPSFHNQYYPIYNTTNGTKMILSNVNGTAEVFSLSGTFTAGIAQNNILGNSAQISLFPNPSIGSNMITVNYQLPQEIKTANLLIYDTQGKQVKSFKIGNGMNSILLDSSMLSKGMYFYSIQTEDGQTIASQKSIVVQ
ncbi:MAG: T9SS type A sorting domain-containing protein [Bacteroidetes bacterium]|nr:T9SS type A sorting domain-containing protein [Bacteroidota bacterium]